MLLMSLTNPRALYVVAAFIPAKIRTMMLRLLQVFELNSGDSDDDCSDNGGSSNNDDSDKDVDDT